LLDSDQLKARESSVFFGNLSGCASVRADELGHGESGMLHQDSLVNQNLQRAPSGLTRSRQLNSDLFALQEQLHRRIASELHDSTCQHLVAASLGLMQIRNALSDPPTIERHCEQLDVSINSALNELRSVAYLLLPQDLFEGGLKAAIEQYAAGFAARTSLVVEVSISPEVDTLPYEKQQSLMRIAQEALTNVHRHARATKVDITIQAREGEFNLEIRDDGQGMEAADGARRSPAPTFGAGLRIMQARLREMGGRFEIFSSLTGGRRETILRATFPYEPL
jgi:signal transduction histidine kinase